MLLAFVNALFTLSFLSCSVSIVSSQFNKPLEDHMKFMNTTSLMINRPSSSLVDAVPDPLITYLAQHSSYFTTINGDRMFYYFFNESSPENSPVAIWLTGIPGLTSSISLFRENGPFRFGQGSSLIRNEYSWDKVLNLIYVDEPCGTGFSTKISGIPYERISNVDDLYNFLQAFFAKHHMYRGRDFYILGQSFAGIYGFALAFRIYNENRNGNVQIPLKGVSIGNGFINPRKQFESIPSFLKTNNLLLEDEQIISELSEGCQTSMKSCEQSGKYGVCKRAFHSCDALLGHFSSKRINIYNFEEPYFGRLHYDFSDVDSFLNNQALKHALGVNTGTYIPLFNYDIYTATMWDLMRNAEADVITLLNNGIHVHIYAGEKDIASNWKGNLKTVTELNWNGRDQFLMQQLQTLRIEGEPGEVMGYGPLHLSFINNAGHMVAMNKPKVAFDLLKLWIEATKPN